MNRENLWKNYTEKEKNKIFKFAEEYKIYLDSAKTEREFVTCFSQPFSPVKQVFCKNRKGICNCN